MHGAVGLHLARELASQPSCWADTVATVDRSSLPDPDARVAVVGCGTSLNIAIAWAQLRERAGLGHTDAWPASEAILDRAYDAVVAISRSGTTTEVDDLVRATSLPTVAIVADGDTPVAEHADAAVVLADADEESVVQTRFATTTLAVLRAHIGHDLEPAIHQARQVVEASDEDLFGPLLGAEQVTFLGTQWVYGLAEEAALKLRESAQFWSEAYRSMEYRHGPISIAAPGRGVWALNRLPPGLADDITATGATLVTTERDPMAELVAVHRYALRTARDRDLDPDTPRSLARSVILS